MLMGPFFCTNNEEIDFEENKFNEFFGECSFFYIKRPITIECHMYKVTLDSISRLKLYSIR